MGDPHAALLPFDAVLFDLDGVLTSTAKIHAACWKSMFDDFLRKYADRNRQSFVPFDIESDYRPYVDGKPRYKGVRSFLESRNIKVPYGNPADDPTIESVCGLGNRKDELVKQAIAAGEVEAYSGSVALVRKLHERKLPMAVVSSSNNCKEVLEVVGLSHRSRGRDRGHRTGSTRQAHPGHLSLCRPHSRCSSRESRCG